MNTNRHNRIDRIAVFCINTLCILIPLSLLVAFLASMRLSSPTAQDTTLIYTVTLPTVREEYTGGLRKDVPVLDAVSKRQIGRVLSYTVTPAVTQSYSRRAGRMRLVNYPGHKTVTLTIRADGKAISGGYSLSGFTLFRGLHLSLRLPNFVGTGICTELHAISR